MDGKEPGQSERPNTAPPRMTFIKNSPTCGTVPTILSPTCVAQYAV